MRHHLDWRLTWREFSTAPDHEWVPAAVPGAVQRDWGRAQGWPDPHDAPCPGPYDWMEDVWWIYRASLPPGEAEAGAGFFLRFEGIDYRFEVYRGDDRLPAAEGMFTEHRIDLGSRIHPGEAIELRIAPVPKLPGETGRAQARRSCKPAMSYGWDWHPRLVPSGIWRPCSLGIEPLESIGDISLRSELTPDFNRARVEVEFDPPLPEGHRLECALYDDSGNPAAQSNTSSLTVENPVLWWPRGEGPQTLYTFRIRQLNTEGTVIFATERRLGFRRIRLLMNEGSWSEPALFPKSRSAAPATLEVNGRRIFAKGTNWITPKLFYGEITREDFSKLIDRAAEANLNLLRVWGGGIVNPPEFFALCDAAGLLVIQEFPLACNDYPDDPAYLEVLDRESAAIIRRLRHHPSLAVWGGGNELYNEWSGMGDQHRALRLLNANCLRLDAERPFLPTMPVEGMGHGPYTYFDKERHLEVTELMAEAGNTAYTEFGQPGPAPVDVLRRIIPAEELWPPRPGTAWERHHGLNAFYPESWLSQNILDHLFGPAADLETLVEQGQRLQAFGYQIIYETARRQWPHCSMAINWCFNEIWPCAANNSLLAWPDRPKPAYYAVQSACRRSLFSAEITNFLHAPRTHFKTRIWLLNDGPEPVEAATVRVRLKHRGEDLELAVWTATAQAGRNKAGPVLEVPLPQAWTEGDFELELSSDDPDLSNAYLCRLGTPREPLDFGDARPGAEKLNQ